MNSKIRNYLNLNVFMILIIINCYVFKCLYYFYLYTRKTQTILRCRYSRNFVIILFTLTILAITSYSRYLMSYSWVSYETCFCKVKERTIKKRFSPDDVNSQQSMKRRVLWSPRCLCTKQTSICVRKPVGPNTPSES